MSFINLDNLTPYRTIGTRSAMGRNSIVLVCPFCLHPVKAYVWSLCGSGKRCACGAMHTGYGSRRPTEDEVQKAAKRGLRWSTKP